MQLTKEMIAYWSPSPQALGRSLVPRFTEFFENGDTIWGSCEGGGGAVYTAAADLSRLQAPLFSCTCPSRQNPCKHVLALLTARADSPKKFSKREVPDGILRPPPRAKKNSLKTSDIIKDSIRAAGLERALSMLAALAADMPGTLFPASSGFWRTAAGGLSGSLIPAIADRMGELPYIFQASPSEAAEEAVRLFALCRRALEWLGDPDRKHDYELETLLGRVWKTDELAELGFSRRSVRLVQLCFSSHDRPYARHYEEIGIWCEPSTGELHRTVNYRPYAAAGRVRADDSCFDCLDVDELYIYPGIDRVRWKNCVPGPVAPGDFACLCDNASPSLGEALDPLLPALRNRFLLRRPCCLVRFSSVIRSGGRMWLCDAKGEAIELRDGGHPSLRVLEAVYSSEWHAALLELSLETGVVNPVAEPLCLLSRDRALRLSV